MSEDDEKQRYWDESAARNQRADEQDKLWRNNVEKIRIADLDEKERREKMLSGVDSFPDLNRPRTGGSWILYIIIGLIILINAGRILNYLHQLIHGHWAIAGLLFTALLIYIFKTDRINLLLKVPLFVYCSYALFTSIGGFKMQGVVANWAGEYILTDQSSSFHEWGNPSASDGKSKKDPPLPIPLSLSKGFVLKEDNTILFNNIKKTYVITPVEYYKFFQRATTWDDKKYPVGILSSWQDAENGQVFPQITMTIEEDTLNLHFYSYDYSFDGKYVKK